MRKRALLSAACAVGLIFGAAAYGKKDASDARQFSQQLSKDNRVEQALSRLTFGARPGDAEQVRKTGLKKWIDQQLHPKRIAENPVLEEKLKYLDTLQDRKSVV